MEVEDVDIPRLEKGKEKIENYRRRSYSMLIVSM